MLIVPDRQFTLDTMHTMKWKAVVVIAFLGVFLFVGDLF
jgi:hypothetical protein